MDKDKKRETEDKKKETTELLYSLVTTTIAVAGVFYSNELNIVAALLLAIGMVKNCYLGLLKEYKLKAFNIISIIINVFMLCISIYLLFLIIGVYNGSEQIGDLKDLSILCVIKAGIDFVTSLYLMKTEK